MCSSADPSLIWCIARLTYGKFFTGAFLKLINDLLLFVGPLLLEYLIWNYLVNSDVWKSISWSRIVLSHFESFWEESIRFQTLIFRKYTVKVSIFRQHNTVTLIVTVINEIFNFKFSLLILTYCRDVRIHLIVHAHPTIWHEIYSCAAHPP